MPPVSLHLPILLSHSEGAWGGIGGPMPPLMPPVSSHLPILLSHSGGGGGHKGGHRGAYAPSLVAPTNFAESFRGRGIGGHRRA